MNINQLPTLGVGIGLRQEIESPIMDALDQIDFLEIITEHYISGKASIVDLKAVCEKVPVIPHGVTLSIGSPQLDRDLVQKIKIICDTINCPYYSEHLCLTKSSAFDIGHLSPLFFTEEILETVIQNTRQFQDMIERPLILENITYEHVIPQNTMSQEEFFGRLVEATNCGILLDVTNIHTNTVNHQIDPKAFISGLPLENVVQVHVAGGFYEDDHLVDSHSEPVEEGSWELLAYLVQSVGKLKGVILEHDDNFPSDFSQLIDQLNIARRILESKEYVSVERVMA